jgi:hypothetical protein
MGTTPGTPGNPGNPGPTGMKDSIVKTPNGNFAFACFEGAEAEIFEVHFLQSGKCIPLTPEFVSCVVPGSLYVKSVVPSKAVRVHAGIVGTGVFLDGPDCAVTVVVAGINRHFKDWNMPAKTGQEREHSWKWWRKAHP